MLRIQRTTEESSGKAAHGQNGYVEVLQFEEAIVADGVVEVLPESVDGMSNIANMSLGDFPTLGLCSLEETYLIVMRPTPANIPITAKSCQNSIFLIRAHPRISAR